MLTDREFHPMEEEIEDYVIFSVKKNLLEIFNKLDKKDGNQDGQIDCKFLRKHLKEETEMHKKLGLNRRQIETLILEADHNGDGFLDEEEFMSLATKKLKCQKSKSVFRQYFESLAYAEECKFCPLFIIIISIIQIFFFGMNLYHYPDKLEPKCSYFIFL